MNAIGRATKSVTEASIKASKSLYSKTKEGLGKLIESDAVTNLKTKVFYFMYEDEERVSRREKPYNYPKRRNFDENTNYYNFAERNTASTVHPQRRQSMNYRNRRIPTFHYDEF